MKEKGPEFEDEYFKWMARTACNRKEPLNRWGRVLKILNSITYRWTNPMDGNRASDAYEMREEYRDLDLWIAEELPFELGPDGGWPCSVMEVLVAFARRIEDDIMSDPDKGNRTGQWFFGMLMSIGVHSDSSEQDVKDAVDAWMDGNRSIFPKPDGYSGSNKEWLGLEMWKQMNEFMGGVE